MDIQAVISELIEQMDGASAPSSQNSGGNKCQVAKSLGLSEVSLVPKGRLEQSEPCSSFEAVVAEPVQPEAEAGAGAEPLKQNMFLDVAYKDLSVKLRTENSIGLDVCSLTAQIATLAELLSIANNKLDQSNRKIGFLEAQIVIQDEQIRQLKLDKVAPAKRKLSSEIRAHS